MQLIGESNEKRQYEIYMASHKYFLKENKKIIKVFLVAGTILCPADMAMKYMHGDNLHEHYSKVYFGQ